MTRLLLLTHGELTRDPRARRAAVAGRAQGFDVYGLCRGDAASAIDLPSVRIERVRPSHTGAGRARSAFGPWRQLVLLRELRSIYRLGRLVRLTASFVSLGLRMPRADVIHAHDLETLPAAWFLKARWRARLVYDAHELYSAQEPDPPRLHRAVTAALERALGPRADAVVTVNEPIAQELKTKLGLDLSPIVVLNCPPRGGTDPVSTEGRLRAVYQGAMGPGRDLDDLLRAAEHTDGVELVIRVMGADVESLRAEVHRRGLEDHVLVVDPVPPDRLVDALVGADVGLIINRPVTRNDELALPNKLFEYLMAGAAVVAPHLPALAAIVEGEGVGVTFAPGDPRDLGRALSELARDRDRLLGLRRRARALALERYNAEAQAEALNRAWGT